MLIHSLDSGRIVLELSTKSGSKFINLGGEDQNRIDEDDDHPRSGSRNLLSREILEEIERNTAAMREHHLLDQRVTQDLAQSS
jgi:hypothetical protein